MNDSNTVRSSREELAMILDTVADGVVAMDGAGRITFVITPPHPLETKQ